MNYNTCMMNGFVNVALTSLPIIPSEKIFSRVTANEPLVGCLCVQHVSGTIR